MKPELGKCKKFLDSGFSLVCVGQNKIPNFAWKKHQSEPYDKDEFEKHYNYSGGLYKKDSQEIPATSGIGIITGFNNLEVIDIDLKTLSTIKEQQDFWTEYTGFLRDNIDDFDLKFVIYKTINGGYHILYRCQKVEGNLKIAKLKDHKEAIIETRGIGGYVFIYSNQVSKKSYFEIQEISESDRDVLFSVSRFYNYVDESISIQPEKITYEAPENSLSPWEDFNSKTSIFDIIENEFTVVKQLSDKYIIRREGATSPHSGYVYKDSGCMYLFSTGTIYQHEKLISPFSAYAIKNCNGDFSRAASELYKKGFGARIVRKVDELQKQPKVDYSSIKFPLDIFPVELQNYILQCNETLDSSIDYMGCSLLWSLSVMVGNALKIQVKPGWIEPATMWITIVGKAGIGKTPSISNMIFPLQKVNSREVRNFVKAYDKYNDYMSMDKKDKENTEKINKPRNTQFIADDITLEALVDLHEENKNAVAVFKDELSGWIKDMNKYRAGSDLEFWLSTWSAKSVSLNRKTAKSSFVSQPLIPVLGGIQPGVFESFYTEENKDNGFIDRMLLCYPDLMVEEYNDNELSSDVIEWHNEFMVFFYNFIKDNLKFNEDDDIQPVICRMSDDAKREWKRIFNKITAQQNDEGENEYMKSMLPKQKSYIPRFALLLNTLNAVHTSGDYDQFSTISLESMLNAERLSDYFVSMAKKVKVATSEVTEIKKILKMNDTKSSYEKFVEIYKANPDFNRKEAAEKLNISRKTIYKYIERVTQEGDTKVTQGVTHKKAV